MLPSPLTERLGVDASSPRKGVLRGLSSRECVYPFADSTHCPYDRQSVGQSMKLAWREISRLRLEIAWKGMAVDITISSHNASISTLSEYIEKCRLLNPQLAFRYSTHSRMEDTPSLHQIHPSRQLTSRVRHSPRHCPRAFWSLRRLTTRYTTRFAT